MGETHPILILYSRKFINQKYFVFNFLNRIVEKFHSGD
ncbi:hypothetical protein LEP1GSC074_0339 [Leptospira noguchii str. Hook]|nr:hypothetical protein LEP1GSC074_0339 [Leptospira noguchii str. Hook]